MATIEERVTAIEREVKQMKNDIVMKLDDTNQGVTMFLGVLQSQGQDIKDIKITLAAMHGSIQGKLAAMEGSIQGKLAAMEGDMNAMKIDLINARNRLVAIEHRLDAHDMRFDTIDTRFNTLDEKVDAVLALLNRQGK